MEVLHFAQNDGRGDDFEKAFPDPERDSRMDFLCQLDTGELVLVEMQVMPENQGDLRFLSYAAGVYNNQSKRGGKTKDIKKVIAINLLGCGLQGTPHWKDAPPRHPVRSTGSPGEFARIKEVRCNRFRS
jgi:hypothetical protein